MKHCEDCGCRVYEYGCVNCNEIDYITMQDDTYYEPNIENQPTKPTPNMTPEEILKECLGEIRYNINGSVTNSQIIEAMKRYASQPQATGGWISVGDRLPENTDSFTNDVVLFWSKKHGFSMIGCYDIELNNWTRLPWERGYQSLSFDEVTHWQPLPPPPSDK